MRRRMSGKERKLEETFFRWSSRTISGGKKSRNELGKKSASLIGFYKMMTCEIPCENGRNRK